MKNSKHQVQGTKLNSFASPQSLLIVGLFLVIGIVGCGPAASLTAPVSGKVTFRGKPCDGALVVFHPKAAEKVNDPKPFATTLADGSYQLTTTVENDGAEVGAYGVTIVWNKPDKEAKMSLSGEGGDGTDRLQGKYGNPSSPKLSATVEKGKLNTFDFSVD